MGTMLAQKKPLESIQRSQAINFVAEIFYDELQFILDRRLLDHTMVNCHGMNSRVKSRDVLSVSEQHVATTNAGKEYILLNLARNSIYHQLPELLFHPLVLSTEKGSVMMKDKEGNSYTADGEGNITISASKSITLCVGENKIMIDSEGNISSNAEKDITESAGANIAQSAENIDCTASSNYNISSTDFTASGSSSATVSGTTKATIDSSGTTAVAGTIVKLN